MTSKFVNKTLAYTGAGTAAHEDRDDLAFLAIRIVFYAAAAILVMSLVLFCVLALA